MFDDYLNKINDNPNKEKMISLLNWVNNNFKELAFKIAWNQPMFTHHETFIIGFSVSKNHISIAPEKKALSKFEKEITAKGYVLMNEIFKVSLNEDIDYELLEKIIKYNIENKKDVKSFWRKSS